MCLLSQKLPAAGFDAKTRADSHRHPTLSVSVLPQSLHPAGQDGGPHPPAHRRKALRLRGLRQRILREWKPQEAYAGPRQGAAADHASEQQGQARAQSFSQL